MKNSQQLSRKSAACLRSLQLLARHTFSRNTVLFFAMFLAVFANFYGFANDVFADSSAPTPSIYDYYAQNGVMFYSANTTGCSSSNSASASGPSAAANGSWDDPSTQTGKWAQEEADWLEAHGIGGAGIAGVFSNQITENSAFDPFLSEGNRGDLPDAKQSTFIASGVSDGGYGLFQFTPSAAWGGSDVNNPYGEWSGYTSPSVENEMDFTWNAFTSAGTTNGVKNNPTLMSALLGDDPYAAAGMWANQIESGNNTAANDYGGHVDNAVSIYNNTNFKLSDGKTLKELAADPGKAGANSPTPGDSPSGGCSAGGAGDAGGDITKVIQNFLSFCGISGFTAPSDWSKANGSLTPTTISCPTVKGGASGSQCVALTEFYLGNINLPGNGKDSASDAISMGLVSASNGPVAGGIYSAQPGSWGGDVPGTDTNGDTGIVVIVNSDGSFVTINNNYMGTETSNQGIGAIYHPVGQSQAGVTFTSAPKK